MLILLFRTWTIKKKRHQKVPLACDTPPVKSRNFCQKHMTYQNHGIDDANVWVPSIYHDYLRYQLWRAICFFQKHISMKLSVLKSNFLPIINFEILMPSFFLLNLFSSSLTSKGNLFFAFFVLKVFMSWSAINNFAVIRLKLLDIRR